MSTLTQADLDRLERAIVMGEAEVEYESGGERRKIKYRSVSAMREALSLGRDALAAQSGVSGRVLTTLAEYGGAD